MPTAQRAAMLDEVLDGLNQEQKQLPSKFFYDERGSELFEQITHLDEYYPTRTEIDILETNLNEIVSQVGSKAALIELGSGSSRKTKLLLDELNNLSAYIPVDISEDYLLKVASGLRVEYPKISIIPVFADYTTSFSLPDLNGNYDQQVLFFPGSTIGNFNPDKARSFLNTIADITDDNAEMLIGVDLKKDPNVLEVAYNDEQGVTAQFNKNMLVRLNRELNANFDPDQFEHRAIYNHDLGRVEMHLIAQSSQQITISGQNFYFAAGETIHTENSYKYSQADFKKLVDDWFTVEEVWTDRQDYFSLQYLKKK